MVEKKKSDDSFERVMKARKAIIDMGAKPRSVGSLCCPVCNGGGKQERTLHWSMASNGHIHARCDTQGCVAWME